MRMFRRLRRWIRHQARYSDGPHPAVTYSLVAATTLATVALVAYVLSMR